MLKSSLSVHEIIHCAARQSVRRCGGGSLLSAVGVAGPLSRLANNDRE